MRMRTGFGGLTNVAIPKIPLLKSLNPIMLNMSASVEECRFLIPLHLALFGLPTHCLQLDWSVPFCGHSTFSPPLAELFLVLALTKRHISFVSLGSSLDRKELDYIRCTKAVIFFHDPHNLNQ